MSRQVPLKQALLNLLEDHLLNQKMLTIQWNCVYCGKKHGGNLLKKVHSFCYAPQNDQIIELRGNDGNVFSVIAISKNKKVSQTRADEYRLAGPIYIELQAPEDRDNLLQALIVPRFVNTCLNPRCKDCGGFQIERNLFIIDCQCWKCKAAMKVAVLDCNGYHAGPDGFTKEEVDFARGNGVIIENKYSKTIGDSYLANTCPQCNVLTGDHYLFTDYFTAAIYGDYKYEQFPQGYGCGNCELNTKS